MEEISCDVDTIVDAKRVISKHLSDGIENRNVKKMNVQHKQN